MAGDDDQRFPRVVVLWTCAVFLAISLVGHLVTATLDAVWGIIAVFGVLGIAQAFLVDGSSNRSDRR